MPESAIFCDDKISDDIIIICCNIITHYLLNWISGDLYKFGMSPGGHCRDIILVPSHIVKSLPVISRSGTRRGASSSNDLQRLNLKIGHQVSSPING